MSYVLGTPASIEPTSSSHGKRLRSKAWDHFVVTRDGYDNPVHAECKYCHAIVQCKTKYGTGVLSRQVKSASCMEITRALPSHQPQDSSPRYLLRTQEQRAFPYELLYMNNPCLFTSSHWHTLFWSCTFVSCKVQLPHHNPYFAYLSMIRWIIYFFLTKQYEQLIIQIISIPTFCLLGNNIITFHPNYINL